MKVATKVAVLCLLVIGLQIAPAAAADAILRVGPAFMNLSGGATRTWDLQAPGGVVPPEVLPDTDRQTVHLSDTTGLAIGYELRLGEVVGVDFNLAWSLSDVRNEGLYLLCGDPPGSSCTVAETEGGPLTLGEVHVVPLTVGLNFHIWQNARVDTYVGPFAGYVWFSDVEAADGLPFPGGDELNVDGDAVWGAVAGLDAALGRSDWTFSLAARYLQTTAELDDDFLPAVDIEPLVVSVQAGYRF